MRTNNSLFHIRDRWKMVDGKCLPCEVRQFRTETEKMLNRQSRLLMEIIVFFISILSFSVSAQSNQVNWSAFDTGFGYSNSTNSIIISAAGESFIGISTNGNSKIISGFLVYNQSIITGIADEGEVIPTKFELYQNYPNPFNPSTKIVWQLPVSSYVTLKIYDILGNEIAALVNENKEPGYYETNFDGSSFASGMYLYRLNTGSYISTKKMLIIK